MYRAFNMWTNATCGSTYRRSEEHTSELQSPCNLVCRLLLEKIDLNTIWKQGKMGEVQEGDQIRPGVPFMQVVDPSRMEVQVPVNQEDFLRLRVGQTAKVHLDAYPQLVFPGKVEEMAPIGRNGDFSSKLRSFAVVFSISGSDTKLMPDLSAAVDVDLAYPGGAEGGAR